MNSLTSPDIKILRHPDRLAAFQSGRTAFPISAEIDLTWRCALNCKLCHSKWLHQDIELSQDQIRRVLTQLHGHGAQAVTFTGGGDPLESPHWRYAVNLAHDLGFDQAVYSYLPRVDQKLVNFLASKLAFVYTHSCNTRGLSRPAASKTVWTYGWLLDESNWTQIPDMVRRTNLDFFNFVDFRPLCPENKPGSKPLDYGWIPDAVRLLKSESARESRVKWAEYKFSGLQRRDAGRNYGACYSTDFTTCIGPNGDVYECINRRGFPDSILGNLLTEDLAEIWKRKSRCRTDMSNCRIMCRNNSLNQTLWSVFGPEVQHSNFV